MSPTNVIHNFIRGLSPFPSAWTVLSGKVLKIHQAAPIRQEHNHPSGTVLIENQLLKVACENGFIEVQKLQLEGKKRMEVSDFLRGMNSDDLNGVLLHL